MADLENSVLDPLLNILYCVLRLINFQNFDQNMEFSGID